MRKDMLRHMKERLEDLQGRLDAKGLPSGEDKTFDMAQWARKAIVHDGPDLEMDCGFAGCAIGWAAHERWFETFGWQIDLVPVHAGRAVYPLIHKMTDPVVPGNKGSIMNEQAFISAAKMLGLSRGMVEQLFNSEYYPSDNEPVTPMHVAERIGTLLTLGEDGLLAKLDGES